MANIIKGHLAVLLRRSGLTVDVTHYKQTFASTVLSLNFLSNETNQLWIFPTMQQYKFVTMLHLSKRMSVIRNYTSYALPWLI